MPPYRFLPVCYALPFALAVGLALGAEPREAQDRALCQIEVPLRAQRSSTAITRELAALRTVDARPDREKRLEISRLLFWQARYTNDARTKRALLEEALSLTSAARGEEPDNPGALIGYAASKGELARIRNLFVALGYVKEVEATLSTLKALNPGYAHYAADRGLGMLYDQAPAFFSIGSRTKARAALEASVKGEENYPGNQIAFADFLARQGERSEAKRWARRALEGATDPAHAVEAYDWARTACEILESSQ